MEQEARRNPYAPPVADVAPGGAPPKRRAWKAYFWFVVFMVGLSAVSMLAFAHLQILDLVDHVAMGVGALGLYGYAYRHPLLGLSFWRAWLPLQIAWDLLVQFVLVPAGLTYVFQDLESSTATEGAYALLFSVPLYIALFRYGHRSSDLWPAE
jgi:hypothetical protein